MISSFISFCGENATSIKCISCVKSASDISSIRAIGDNTLSGIDEDMILILLVTRSNIPVFGEL
jgi:hypothetical protein